MRFSRNLHGWRIICVILAGLCVIGEGTAATELKSDEQVILFPTVGSRRATNDGWVVDIHGLVSEPENRRVVRWVLRKALGLDASKLSSAEKKTFNERSGYFLADNHRGVAITVRAASQDYPAGRSAAMATSQPPPSGLPVDHG
jgi:hypothetical protein